MMARLDQAGLAQLPPSVARPGYDRRGLETGIVHLGLGAFHRAHQAVFTDDALRRSPGPWGICGVSLRAPDTRDALGPQDGLYTLGVRHPDGLRLRVVGAVTHVLVAPEDPAAVLDRLCRPSTRIVTATVTEKGYCHRPADGTLDEGHPDIRHDLAAPDRPRTLPGFLVEALARRRRDGLAPFTVLSCDNLSGNGRVTAAVLSRFAALRDPGLARWVEDRVACPDSMVDRIVPATTDADRLAVAGALGLRDAWPVMAEPFSQWVMQDRFPTGRPAWEREGAEMVADVRPHELMKLRMLNGSHSCIAYLGFLAGHATVADAMADPVFARFVDRLMAEEVAPTLDARPGMDPGAYRAALLARFANPALRHQTSQIAMDGTQKLPPRLLDTIRHRLYRGAPFDRLALGVAAWMRYVAGADERGAPIAVRDPLAAQLADLVGRAGPVSGLLDDPGPAAGRLVSALLGLRPVFGDDLPCQPAFVETLRTVLARLLSQGARRTLGAME